MIYALALQAVTEAAKSAGSTTGSIVLDATIVSVIVTGVFTIIREWLRSRSESAKAARAQADADRAEAQLLGHSGASGDRSREPVCMSSPAMVGMLTTQAVMKQTQDDMKVLMARLTESEVSQGEMLKQLVRSTNLLVRCASRNEISQGKPPLINELTDPVTGG